MEVGGCRAAETRIACIKFVGATVVFSGILGAATAGGFVTGSKLSFPKYAI